jgi:hypothetical protein
MGFRAMCSGYATRLASSALCVALWAGGTPAQDTVRLVVQSSSLAGFRYHAAAGVWTELRIGDALELVREADNPHDPHALSLSCRGHKLGYVPRRDNEVLAWCMDRGDILRARISRLTLHPNPARRIEFEIYAQ